MAETLRATFPAVHPKKPAKASLRGEGGRKFLAEVSLGPVIERCFALSGLTKDQAAAEMEYADSSTVSRWISGVENPHIARIWAAKRLRTGLLMALAEAANEQVEIATTFTVRRRSA